MASRAVSGTPPPSSRLIPVTISDAEDSAGCNAPPKVAVAAVAVAVVAVAVAVAEAAVAVVTAVIAG